MTRKEEREHAAKQSIKGDSFEDGCIGKGYFIIGAEWADRTMLDKVCKYLYRKLENGKVLSSQLIDDLRYTMKRE